MAKDSINVYKKIGCIFMSLIYIEFEVSIATCNNRKFVTRFQLKKTVGRMGVLPQAVTGVLPRGNILFFIQHKQKL